MRITVGVDGEVAVRDTDEGTVAIEFGGERRLEVMPLEALALARALRNVAGGVLFVDAMRARRAS